MIITSQRFIVITTRRVPKCKRTLRYRGRGCVSRKVTKVLLPLPLFVAFLHTPCMVALLRRGAKQGRIQLVGLGGGQLVRPPTSPNPRFSFSADFGHYFENAPKNIVMFPIVKSFSWGGKEYFQSPLGYGPLPPPPASAYFAKGLGVCLFGSHSEP